VGRPPPPWPARPRDCHPDRRIVHAIYEGRIVYTPTSFLELIPDHYKQKPIQLYDPRDAPLLNQYRLIVPRTRNALEIAHFVVLLGLYMLVMAESGSRRDADGVGVHMTKLEALFALYSFGWALDQFSTVMSHGWHVYTQNLWSFLDVGFAVIYLVYLVLRVDGWRSGADAPAQQAFDVLALGALVLVPRLAFNLLSDNLVFLSLRSMMSDFSLLTALSAWCFFGFLLSLYWLGDGSHMPVYVVESTPPPLVFFLVPSLTFLLHQHHQQVDALDLVRARRHRHPALGRLPLAARPQRHDCLCLSRQHALPDHPRVHAHKHV
jgi:hypothetical protein